MDDSKIIELFYERSEQAIIELSNKYGAICNKVADNILNNRLDSEECVNDTYMSAWNSMPEERPNLLAPFLAAITRNHALDLYRKNHSLKRGAGETALALDELLDMAGAENTEASVDEALLSQHINTFLSGLEKQSRMIFVRRYFYVDSLVQIADAYSMSESAVKSQLFRIRQKLKEYLDKEGYET